MGGRTKIAKKSSQLKKSKVVILCGLVNCRQALEVHFKMAPVPKWASLGRPSNLYLNPPPYVVEGVTVSL